MSVVRSMGAIGPPGIPAARLFGLAEKIDALYDQLQGVYDEHTLKLASDIVRKFAREWIDTEGHTI